VRGARALDLVQNGRRSMGEVAELTGFADPRSFRRAFNRWIGRAPSLARAESDESDQTMKQGTGDQETPG
jgi:transcriptional regulator GlxA family with amidase domain